MSLSNSAGGPGRVGDCLSDGSLFSRPSEIYVRGCLHCRRPRPRWSLIEYLHPMRDASATLLSERAFRVARRKKYLVNLTSGFRSRVADSFKIDLPARFDWSIIGCTIRRLALMNLKHKHRIRTRSIAGVLFTDDWQQDKRLRATDG
ncbi:hypothetical protein J6590_021125 [Homalodisca vitripennis]|nr:hypothetical protein J6590_021125 [Homalodisca vitripennis]